MITWTDSARAALETHNQQVRQDLVSSGADPDEVAADLHRHIEEELTAAKIHVATRDEVQRVLGRMGSHGLERTAAPAKSRFSVAMAAGLVLLAVLIAAAGFLYHRPIHHDSYAYPPQWLVPTSQDPARLTLPISVSTHTSEWGQFQPGDLIVVTSVKGDRPDIEVGGRYLIEGRYTLASMEASGLSVSVTAKRGGVGGVSPGHPEEGILVSRGTGAFRLIATMRYPGDFHVSFIPLGGGQSRGTVYFSQTDPSAATVAAKPSLVISIAEDGTLSVDGKVIQNDQLKPLLDRAKELDPNAVVGIRSDPKKQPQMVGFVYGSCRAAGISRFALESR